MTLALTGGLFGGSIMHLGDLNDHIVNTWRATIPQYPAVIAKNLQEITGLVTRVRPEIESAFVAALRDFLARQAWSQEPDTVTIDGGKDMRITCPPGYSYVSTVDTGNGDNHGIGPGPNNNDTLRQACACCVAWEGDKNRGGPVRFPCSSSAVSHWSWFDIGLPTDVFETAHSTDHDRFVLRYRVCAPGHRDWNQVLPRERHYHNGELLAIESSERVGVRTRHVH
jgi:hypothetical protein